MIFGKDTILNALQRRDGFGLAHILRAHLRHKRDEVLRAGFAEEEYSNMISLKSAT